MSEGTHRPDLFRALFGELRYGQTEIEANEALAAAIKAAQDTGKASEIVLRIRIKPKNNGQYFIEDEVKSKLPKLPQEDIIMFGSPEGNLQRDDPRQRKLEFRDVSKKPAVAETRELSTGAAPAEVRIVIPATANTAG